MRYLFLIFCLVLCFCNCTDIVEWSCRPIPVGGLSLNEQEVIDSVITVVYNPINYDYKWWFSNIQIKECTFITPEKIECSWFSAKKASDNTMIVSVKQNETDKRRDGDVYINTDDGKGERCSKNRGGLLIVQCPEPIVIEQSKGELLFSFEGGLDTVTVTTNRSSWLNEPIIGVRYGDGKTRYTYNVYKDIYYNNNHPYYPSIDHWFTINIIDKNNVVFLVSKNESEKERSADVTFDPLNCGTGIKIIQSVE
ncbi:MAG: hypothetical protein LBU83_01835 [Bacteroidales bacterium]|nr:hypothetical protein [Bacteroidales bacterium]